MKISLQISAQLENLTCLKPEGEDFRWYLKLKCLNCGEETHDFVYCTETESSPLTGGRGHASVVLKCKLCKRENSIDIIPTTVSHYDADNAGSFKSVVTFDCRGVEPTDFSPREWYDYDEKAGQSVGISELKHQFITAK
ncbi:UPF0587 protein v1g245604-like isoform X2 [Gigantopelta aegis]|uniref:UPF0587 protein v1g245604-like isoform X2 n=1 Tax=Gigantopelta aegis TaxID=1735272 RepID=UPI001B888B20|nr:UPF0587 protein v1g245604-like isoform X2 [Gigantopelta aegis]